MHIFAPEIVSAVSAVECEKLAELASGKVVLELGSYEGRSTIAMASVATLVHAVDWHVGDDHAGKTDTARTFLENISRHNVRPRIAMHMCRFQDLLPAFKPESFDMAFIDAFHSKEAVERDLKLTAPLIRRNGVIAFHDYGVGGFGVTQVVDAFSRALKVQVEVTRTLAVVKLPL